MSRQARKRILRDIALALGLGVSRQNACNLKFPEPSRKWLNWGNVSPAIVAMAGGTDAFPICLSGNNRIWLFICVEH
jgi:hypothetical protein